MRIRLSLAQATALIDKAESKTNLSTDVGDVIKNPIGEGIDPKVSLAQAILLLKTAVDNELQETAGRIDSMILDLQEQGYTEVSTDLDKVKTRVSFLNVKTKNKYFDEQGNIKEVEA
jgi:hypothetical protein